MNLAQLLFNLYQRELLIIDDCFLEPQIFPAGIQEIRDHAASTGLDMSELSDCRVQEHIQETSAYHILLNHHTSNQIPQAGCVADHREMIVAAARGML